MVTADAADIQTLPIEFENTVKQFQHFILAVTDRLGLVTKAEYDLGWGYAVLTISVQGKLFLLKSLISEKALSLKTETLSSYEALLRSWLDYVSEFKYDFHDRVIKQAKYCVEERMSTHFTCRSTLNDASEFDRFRDERDTIEFFFIGAESILFNLDDIKISVLNIDKALKNFILGEVMPNFRLQENIYLAIKHGNRSWLPDGFWWRHVY